MLKNWPKSIYPIHHPQPPGAASTNHIYKFLRTARQSAAIRKYWTRPKLRLARQTLQIELLRKMFSRVRESARGGEEGITGTRENAKGWMREIDTLIARSGRIERGGKGRGSPILRGKRWRANVRDWWADLLIKKDGMAREMAIKRTIVPVLRSSHSCVSTSITVDDRASSVS